MLNPKNITFDCNYIANLPRVPMTLQTFVIDGKELKLSVPDAYQWIVDSKTNEIFVHRNVDGMKVGYIRCRKNDYYARHEISKNYVDEHKYTTLKEAIFWLIDCLTNDNPL